MSAESVTIEPKYLEMALDTAGIRNSQKRLKSLIAEVAVVPLKDFDSELSDNFGLVQEILLRRVARTIAHWAEHKHDPVKPRSNQMMSEITNASKNDISLESFYINEVTNALHRLAPTLMFDVPAEYSPRTDELEYALIELEERMEHSGDLQDLVEDDAYQYDDVYYDERYGQYDDYDPYADIQNYDDYAADDDPDADALHHHYVDDDNAYEGDYETVVPDAKQPAKRTTQSAQAEQPRADFNFDALPTDESDSGVIDLNLDFGGDMVGLAEIVDEQQQTKTASSGGQQTRQPAPATPQQQPQQAASKAIVSRKQPEKEIEINQALQISAEQTWQLIYGLMGYNSDYIQNTMLPRWKQNPQAFDKDRRYLYGLYIETIRNAAGIQYVAGNFIFPDRQMSVDQLWTHYWQDLSRNVGPQLTAAKLDAVANDPWWKKLQQRLLEQMRNLSPIWLLALAIALVFDGLTTYVSLDQTPMEGVIVPIFTVLITALFQIADQLVINYRQREFDADALSAKYRAQLQKLEATLEGLDTTSESFVQLSMQRSQVQANHKAVLDNRKMARRGRYWSARIADINVIVTAYGFAYLFLNSQEPVLEVVEQINVIATQDWQRLNLAVFLMIGLAITVSFVVNTAQRTEILGWSMRRLKNEA